MKKISNFILLFSLIFLVIGNISHANRDDVSSVKYKGNISGDYTIKVKTRNTACGTEETYKKNVFSKLNVSGENGVNCYKSSGKVICEKIITTSGSAPKPTINSNFEIYATNKEILSYLGVPQKIIDNISGNYVQDISLKMNILVDSNGNLHEGVYNDWTSKFNFSDISDTFSLFGDGNIIEYSDESECNECIKITTGTGANGDSCTGTGSDRECSTDTCSPITIPTPTPPVEICSITPCLNDGITPPNIEYMEIEGCSKKGSIYTCYANETLDFKVKLNNNGSGYTPKGIKNLRLSINNWFNTRPISFNEKEVNITDTNEKTISFTSQSFKTIGNYTLEFQGEGQRGIPGTFSLAKFIKLHIIPNNEISINGPMEISSDSLYANGEDSKDICIPLSDSYGNTFINYGLIEETSLEITKGIHLNQIDNKGDAITVTKKPSFDNSKICFSISSKAPGENIELTLKAPTHKETPEQELDGNFRYLTSIVLDASFKKPFIGKLSASGGLKAEIGTMMQYKLDVIAQQSSTSIDPSLENYKSSINVIDTINHMIDGASDPSPLTNLLGSPSLFEARINTSADATSVDTSPNIAIKPSPIIYYTIGGEKVRYYLSASDDDFDNDDYIKTDETKGFIGVKIEGTSQGDGKYEITGQKENFSDISKSTMRQAIKKNAYELITSLTSGQVVNGIKYIEGGYETISGNLDYETLIVKDGNVIISGDLNTSGKKLGIIVLKDNYDINNDYDTAGNIYITPNVEKINAIIYADGGIISVNNTGKVYDTDSASRTSALQKQLILIGSIFTRNTIGGAIFAGGNYLLPGGQETSDFDTAMMYDLNYLRRGNKGCKDDDADGVCDEYDDTFIIKHNPNIALDPPRGF